jgi:uncharacterized repeat protein (TIGR02059 family)
MVDYSAAAQVSYSDDLTVGPNGGSGQTRPGTFVYPSGFQIWGKMSAPSIASAQSLSVAQASPTSVTVSWSPPASGTINEYVLQYKPNAQNWSSATTRRVTSISGSPSLTVTGLAAGTYDYRVWARNTSTNQSSASPVTVSSVALDTTSPTFSSASVANNGLSLLLTYNETLSATTAAASAFTVRRTRFGWITPETPTVSSVSVSGSSITLNLSATIFAGDTVTVSYTDPSGSDDASALLDVAGNDAASLTNQAVTNNSTQKQNQSALSITPSTLIYGETVTLTTSGGTGTGAVTYTENSAACSISSSTLTGVAAGDCIVTATKATDTNYLETTTTKTITITTRPITVKALDRSATYTGSSVAVSNSFSITSGSLAGSDSITSLTYTYTSIPSGSYSATTAPTNAGNYTITPSTASFSPGTASNYAITYETATLTIGLATQTITFASLANKTLGMSAVTLIASASSGLTVSFSSSDASICSTSGSNGTTLTLVASGTCTITASQGGDSNYQGALDVIRSFTISPTLLLATPTSPSSSLTAPYGASYSLDLSSSLSGGSGGTTYAITTGSLPAGLSLNTSTGLISGTPSSLGDSALVITVTDSNGATSATSSFTISVILGSATATIAFSSTTLTFGVANPITVTVSTAGSVRFSANGRVIKNCKSISTITSGTITATCNYRPATRRPLTITARLTPTDLNIAPRTSTSAQFLVQRRTGR